MIIRSSSRRVRLLVVLAVVSGPALAFADRIQFVQALAVGGRVDWSAANGLLAFDRPGADGYSDVHVMTPNAQNRICLTCDRPLPQAHNGNPSWHPSGFYIVFQSQNPSLPIIPPSREPLAKFLTSPGWGTNNDLWLMTADGSRFWQLTSVSAGMASLHPQFSRSGRRLTWSERVGFDGPNELWVIRVADLVWTGGTPQLTNIVDLTPIGDAFYETHGFTPDEGTILFTAGDPVTSSLDIYTYDLSSGGLQNLTNTPDEYDEHAHLSPDGTRIIWASSRGIDIPRSYFVPYTDYWVMDADGSNQTRITYFNDPTAPEHYPGGVVVADFSFGPDGKWLAAKLEIEPPSLGRIIEVVVAMR